MAESVTVDTLEIEIESRAKGVFTNLDALADSMTRLKAAVKGGAGLTAVKNQLESLNTSLNGININTGKIGELATALGSLSTVQKASGLTSTINALKKLPQITASLNATDLNAFGAKMREVAAAVRPLAEEMQKVSNGFSAFPSRIQKLITQNERLKVSNNKTAKSFNNVNKFSLTTLANLSAYTYVLKKITNFLADSVKSVNDYIENVNLFQVSMGEFYDEAFEYAMLVNEKLGIDPSEWMRNQGVFMAMANGFGLAKKQAYDLSESLTELSYDISSLYNEDMERAAQRLQSALAGEIEPIRRLGISISQATLEEYALSKGIKESVANMTEQEKALLRSLKLIEGAQNIGAIGDFAKTLESPANAMRVLNQQLTQFSRAIGSVFLPVIVQVLPYLQAFVSLLTDAIKALAASAGFVMPDWDNKKWSNNIVDGALGAEDALQDATKAAKELKNATLGIDELNILNPQDKAGNGASGSDWASTLTIPNLWDKKALEQIKTQAAEIKEKFKDIFADVGKGLKKISPLLKGSLAALGAIQGMKLLESLGLLIGKLGVAGGVLATVFAALKAGFGPLEAIKLGWWELQRKIQNLSPFAKATIALAAIAGEAVTVYDAIKQLTLGEKTLGEAFLNISIAVGAAGTALTLVFGPLGALATAVVGVTAAIAGWSSAQKELRESMVKSEFFDGQGIAINDLSDKYSKLIETVSSAYTPILENADAISKNEESTSRLTSEINLLVDGVADGVMSVEETLPRISEAFNTLYDTTKQTLEKQREIILYALSGATGEAYVQLGGDLLAIADVVTKNSGQMIADLEAYNAEFKRIQEEIASGSITGAEGMKQLQEASSKYSAVLSATTPDLNAFKEELSAFANDINYGDAETALNDAQNAFKNVAVSAENAAGDINAAYDEIKKAIQNQIDYMESIGQDASPLYQFAKANENARNDALSDVNSQVQSFVNEVSQNLLKETETQFNAAMENWDSLSWFEQKFTYSGSQAKYVQSALSTYKEEIVKPMTDEMKSAFSTALGEDNIWAETAMEKLLSTLFSTSTTSTFNRDYYSESAVIFASGITDAINNALPESMKKSAEQAINGFSDGIKNGAETLKSEAKNTFAGENGFVGAVDSALDINSPSKVMEQRGIWAVEGFAEGIKLNGKTVINVIKDWSSSIIKAFSEGNDGKNIVTIFGEAGENLVTAFSNRIAVKYIESRSAVTSWASGVKQWFSEIASPNVFAQVAVSIVNGFKDSIINQYGTVKSAMAEFGNAVIDAFERPNGRRSIVTEFEIIGTNVIEGFIEGTSSLWDEAERVIRAFAANIIDSAMEELNENSPSKVFREIGMNVVRGFNIGIEREEAASLNVMNSWLTGVKDAIPSFGVGFEMDYSNIRSFNPESFTQGISANMTASGTATVVGFKEAMEEFYSEMLYPMISQIADDMRRQADKEETTVVNIGNRTVTEAVSAQQSANGYRFVTT